MLRRIGVLFLFILLSLVVFLGQAFAQDGTWTTKAPMPIVRSLAPAVGAITGHLYVAGGHCTPEATALHVYDPGTDAWTTKSPMPGFRTQPGWGVIEDKLYIAGGNDCTTGNVNTLFEYNATVDMWTTKAVLPYAPISVAQGVINGQLNIAGGTVAACASADAVAAYNPTTDAWSSKAPMPVGRAGAASGVVGGKLYVTAGAHTPAGCTGGTLLNSLDVYDPATDTWTTKAPIPTLRNVPAGGVVDGIFYVVGGVGASGESLDTVEAYDPASDTWTTVSVMPTPRQSLGAGVLNGVLYAVGGENSSGALATNEAFTRPNTFIGFLQPVDNPPVVNGGKAGRTYAIKWQLKDSTGNYVTNVNAVTSIKFLSVTCGEFAGDPTSALTTAATGETSLRYDSAANQFIYNWATPGAGCYVLSVTLEDTTVHTANFKLTK